MSRWGRGGGGPPSLPQGCPGPLRPSPFVVQCKLISKRHGSPGRSQFGACMLKGKLTANDLEAIVMSLS